MNQIQITVKEVKEVTHGVKNEQPWTLYNVIDTNGKRYGTFNEKYLDSVGKTIGITVEEKPSTKLNPKTGKPYINLNIIEPKKQPTGMSNDIIEKLFAKLDRIEMKIDNLELVEPTGDQEPPETSPDEISLDEIPF
jgi:hypothetical protein